jgi:DNA-binding response OmpR family regulator
MPPENPIVILLEDCPVTGLLIERAILQGLPGCRLLWARDIGDARRRVTGIGVELFLVDIGLPDGSGLDFLVEMAELHPTARAIVMTASPLPEYQANSAALGVLHFIQKPVHPAELIAQMRTAIGAEQAGQVNEEFSATLRNVTPMDILQFKCLAGDTTVIEFRSGSHAGAIHLHRGEIVHAQTGGLKGPRALNEIMSWKRGKVTELPVPANAERTINCSWQTLLMDAAQRLDEGALAVA